MNDKKTWVTCAVFTEKMNEELHKNPEHQDMVFPHNEDGLDLFAPMLSSHARIALHKATFDKVSKHYTITRP